MVLVDGPMTPNLQRQPSTSRIVDNSSPARDGEIFGQFAGA
jgi:hypothetical protein